MDKDFTDTIRKIDEIQSRIDTVFKRVNSDPVYHTEKAIADAISDNPRFFDSDRKAELAEIFFAVLDKIYYSIVKPDSDSQFCNPLHEIQDAKQFPELNMLMRDMMPLGWALSAKWEKDNLKNTMSDYLAAFTPEENSAILDFMEFLFETFPQFKEQNEYHDFMEYWRKNVNDHESMRLEDDYDKALLLDVMLKKRQKSL